MPAPIKKRADPDPSTRAAPSEEPNNKDSDAKAKRQDTIYNTTRKSYLASQLEINQALCTVGFCFKLYELL